MKKKQTILSEIMLRNFIRSIISEAVIDASDKFKKKQQKNDQNKQVNTADTAKSVKDKTNTTLKNKLGEFGYAAEKKKAAIDRDEWNKEVGDKFVDMFSDIIDDELPTYSQEYYVNQIGLGFSNYLSDLRGLISSKEFDALKKKFRGKRGWFEHTKQKATDIWKSVAPSASLGPDFILELTPLLTKHSDARKLFKTIIQNDAKNFDTQIYHLNRKLEEIKDYIAKTKGQEKWNALRALKAREPKIREFISIVSDIKVEALQEKSNDDIVSIKNQSINVGDGVDFIVKNSMSKPPHIIITNDSNIVFDSVQFLMGIADTQDEKQFAAQYEKSTFSAHNYIQQEIAEYIDLDNNEEINNIVNTLFPL